MSKESNTKNKKTNLQQDSNPYPSDDLATLLKGPFRYAQIRKDTQEYAKIRKDTQGYAKIRNLQTNQAPNLKSKKKHKEQKITKNSTPPPKLCENCSPIGIIRDESG